MSRALQGPMLVEIETNYTDISFFNNSGDLAIKISEEGQPTIPMKRSIMEEGEDYKDAIPNIKDVEALSENNRDQQDMQLVDCIDDENWNIEDAEPLNSKYAGWGGGGGMERWTCQFGFIKI